MMSLSLSKSALERIASVAEILTFVLTFLGALSGVVYIAANRPLKRIEAREAEEEKQKTARAQKEAAEAQLALRKASAFAATPRRIILGSRNGDQEIREAVFKELEKYAGTPTVIVFVQDEEAELLANDIRSALLKA